MAKAAPITAAPAAPAATDETRRDERLPVPVAVAVILGLSALLWAPILYGVSLLFG